jgi:hypothetical protein
MQPMLERRAGTRFGLIADAHVHPGGSPPLPEQLSGKPDTVRPAGRGGATSRGSARVC